MISACFRYGRDEEIPFGRYLKERKLSKYFSRETACAIVSAGELLSRVEVDRRTPVYYCMGVVEHECYGLDSIAAGSTGPDGSFSQQLFVEAGFASVPPLNQFKVLYNMPLTFVSIVFGFTGDNAALYTSADGLLLQAAAAPSWPVLIGAGKAYPDGSVCAGFALARKEDLETLRRTRPSGEAIGLFTAGDSINAE